MPWKESHVTDERLRFVARRLEGEKMAPLCAEFGISRKTGYKKLLPMCPECASQIHALSGAKWRFVKARPEPDFRYFSKRTAAFSVGKCIETTSDHGR